MASIESGEDSGHKKGPGVKKAKKLSTRVDMTPMVDLGFLLITFFVFTATMQTPTTMDLNMPKDTQKQDELTQVKQSGALTILLGKDNQVYYYVGELKPDASNFQQTTFKGIRDVIIKKKQEVIDNYVPSPEDDAKIIERAKENGDPNWQNAAKDRDFVVIIKPDKDATYKNAVDILDEMTINNVKRFAVVKIADTEYQLIQKTEEAAGVK
ncbi:MAG: biopolymer transporter ExbD [Bacteroidetes bacterium]|nr:biopolymer transporter ExbD [Bacteroidota bacterium]MBS1632103.1 biopolymer transporter ExbD [Bacteroidota bacterium]